MVKYTSALQKKKLKNQSGVPKKLLKNYGTEEPQKRAIKTDSYGSLDSNSLTPPFSQKKHAKKAPKIFDIDVVTSPLRASIWHKSNITTWMEKLAAFYEKKEYSAINSIVPFAAKSIKKSLLRCSSKSIHEISKGECDFDVELKADSKQNFYWTAMARCKCFACPLCAIFRSKKLLMLGMAWCFKRRKPLEESNNALLTFTRYHRRDTSVSDLYVALDKQIVNLTRWFQKHAEKDNKFGNTKGTWRGYTASLEATKGDNGPHIHWHVFYTCESKEEMDALRDWYFKTRKKQDIELKKMYPKYKPMAMKYQRDGFLTLSKSGKDKKANTVRNIMNYISKGIAETVSPETKTKQKKGNKLIYHIENLNDAKMYFDFNMATSGKRMWRAGGVCREINGTQSKEEDIQALLDAGEIDLKEGMEVLYTIKQDTPHGNAMARETPDLSIDMIEKEIVDTKNMKAYVTKYFDKYLAHELDERFFYKTREPYYCKKEKEIMYQPCWRLKKGDNEIFKNLNKKFLERLEVQRELDKSREDEERRKYDERDDWKQKNKWKRLKKHKENLEIVENLDDGEF